MSCRVYLIAAGLSASLSLPVLAASDLPESEVVVTATRIPTPIDKVLAPVVVINEAEIDRSAPTDISDLLRFHAGLELSRNGGPGQTTAVFIRGAESNHTLVLIDGVRMNPGTIGIAALQNIPPDMIERVEVVKGPRSALWGTDAIGGVINVVTRRGSRDGWSAEAGYGDYDTRKASLNGGVPLGAAALDFGVSWTDSNGLPTIESDHTDRGYDNLSFSGTLSGQVGSAELALRHWSASGNTEYSDFFLAPVDQDYTDSTTAAEVKLPVTDRGTLQATLSHFEDSIDQNQPPFEGAAPDYLRTRRNSGDVQFDWRATGAQTLSAGAMYSQEDANSLSFGTKFAATTDTLNLFAQDRIEAGRHSALLAVGYTDHETAGNATTWNAEYGYAITPSTRVYGLAGSGFRAPDATDRYGFGGNPDLKPEKSHNYELGIRQRIGEHQLVSLSGFRNEIDDLIEYVVLDPETFDGKNFNVAQARIQGVEAAWSYADGPWQARIEALYQDPRNLTDDTELLRRAKQNLTVSVARGFGPVLLGLNVLAAGERKDFGFPKPVTLDSYVLADLTAQWQVTPALTLVGRVENLFNEQYELASTYNTPDRGLYVTLRYAPPRGQ
jgi:vitamin B12 transporter